MRGIKDFAACLFMMIDIDERTLELDHAGRSTSFSPAGPLAAAQNKCAAPGVRAIVFSNLYGLPDDIEPWRSWQTALRPALIDDACQALLSREAGLRIGLRPDTTGVISFGRGKALSGIGGGAAVSPAGAAASGMQNIFPQQLDSLPVMGFIKHALLGTLIWCLENPSFYTFPARIPFLGLGKTEVLFGFPRSGLTLPQMGHALAQCRELAVRETQIRERIAAWTKALPSGVIQPFLERGYHHSGPVVPTRYPILFHDNNMRRRALEQLARAGLGASASYPSALDGYPELRAHLLPVNCPRARSAASRILTLPVHRYVRETDIAEAAKIIKRCLE